MSGITPLLDTLLHQVLGKRVDTPEPRDLNQPVRPTSPADAPRALHSDSRLDARPSPAAAQETSRARPSSGDSPHARGGAKENAPPASTQIRLSGAGRAISDLLVRFPAPPSTLSIRTPLIAPGQPADPGSLAARLEGSIRDSGLFYESHLSRWYKGELPRQQLEREPQMWRPLRFTPVGLQGAADALAPRAPLAPTHHLTPLFTTTTGPRGGAPPAVQSQPSAPPAMHSPGSASPLPTASATTTDASHPNPSDALRAAAPELSRQAVSSDPVHESLQGIVRHQLEVLVTPALRWEGDVWSGLFMALMILPPPDERRRGSGDETASPDQEAEDRTWHSEIDLDIAGIGRLQASIWMQLERLEIELRISDPVAHRHLATGMGTLRERLTGHGFSQVEISLDTLEEEKADDHG